MDVLDEGWIFLDGDHMEIIHHQLLILGMNFISALDPLLRSDKFPYPNFTLLQFRDKVGVLHKKHSYTVGSS